MIRRRADVHGPHGGSVNRSYRYGCEYSNMLQEGMGTMCESTLALLLEVGWAHRCAHGVAASVDAMDRGFVRERAVVSSDGGRVRVCRSVELTALGRATLGR